MDINQVYAKLDEMFHAGQNGQVEDFLIDCIQQAQAQGDYNSVIMLLNEMIGFCRQMGMKEKSLAYSSQVLQLMEQMGLKNTVSYGTTLLNVANACRAAGKLDAAYQFYMEIFPIYEEYLAPDDYCYAALYNNMSLLFQETEEYEKSVECLNKALHIIKKRDDSPFDTAVTHTNIASSLCMLATQAAEEERALRIRKADLGYDKVHEIACEALGEAEIAIEAFRRMEVKGVHAAAALAAYADALMLLRRYEAAETAYAEALAMIEETVGRTEAYQRVAEKLAFARGVSAGEIQLDEYGLVCREEETEREKFRTETAAQTGEAPEKESATAQQAGEIVSQAGEKTEAMTGMELARAYFETCGKRMLMEQFPEYVPVIAAGLCGEGSECLGFDDDYSTDHDFGPGFALWVDDETYEKIGEELQAAYDALPKEFMGYRRVESPQGKGRCGVCTYRRYLERILGMDHVPRTDAEWLYASEEALLAAVSGEVFVDPSGKFTALLNELKAYYPETVWRRRIAQEMTLFSQNGQYNYLRMFKRNDQASANLLLGKACENAMRLLYLLNRQYAPHTKWLLRGMEEMSDTQMAEDLITGLLYEVRAGSGEAETKAAGLEKLAAIFLAKLKELMLVEPGAGSTYLADYAQQIAYGTAEEKETGKTKEKDREEEMNVTREEMVDAIVMLEWKAFDKVKNEGGRADCQDNFATFEVMRKSQYLTWTDEMLEQYLYDFKRQTDNGWNPIMEKYARMMESTAPEKYEEMKKDLPVIAEDKKAIMEEIIKVQVAWMEEMAEKYPKVASGARVIHTSEDTAADTSYETYLRGELGTYSDEMLLLYGRFIASLAQGGRNLAMLTMENTVKMYGYQDLEDAEAKMW